MALPKNAKERELFELRTRVAQLESELSASVVEDSDNDDCVSGVEMDHEYGVMMDGIVEVTESLEVPPADQIEAESRSDDQSDHPNTSSSKRRIGRCLCPTCGRKFPFQSELRRHMLVHSTPDERNALKKFECSVCQKRFSWKCDLLRHSPIHSSEKAHTCTVCEAAFKVQDGLRKHMLLHSESSAKCERCYRVYKSKEALSNHSCSRSRCKSYTCSTCGKSFARKDLLVVHTRSHTGELPYICVVCNKGFVTASKCSVHLSTHRSKPYLCMDCKKCFATPTALNGHLGVDEEAWAHFIALSDVQTTHCKKQGIVLVQLEIVVEQHDDDQMTPSSMSPCRIPAVTIATFPPPLLPPPCPFCCDGCYDVDGLADHMLIHMSPILHRCSNCKQGYDTSTDLEAHQCSMEPTTYSCQRCPDTFTSNCAWVKHKTVAHSTHKKKSVSDKKPLVAVQAVQVVTRDGRQRYQCNWCDKSFTLRSSLRVHTHTHTGRFQCSDCQRCFATPTRLKEHMFIHTGERPFKCDSCEKCFKSFTDRRLHFEDTHLGFRRHCELCNKDFRRAAFLTHRRRIHPQLHARGEPLPPVAPVTATDESDCDTLKDTN